ncbi:MAG: hypothetical protein JNM32_06130 [Dechloromonas sp.]|jgi:type IV pilus assembly protein PilX|nr:hypothetical protein [Dechloromonas sp.]
MDRTNAQRGFALVAALIFMVILSLIAVGLSGTTSSEERMARNFRDQDTAFGAAEAALRDAELHLSGAWQYPYFPLLLTDFNDTCANGLCDSGVGGYAWQPVDNLDFFAASGTGSNSVQLGAITHSATVPGLSNQPRYLIERVKNQIGGLTKGQSWAFRITAQARGRLSSTRVVLQEVYILQNYVYY